jgi:hypothetical protein
MPAYDDRFFNPPAPLARVTLRTSGDVKVVTDVPMLIDSGADVTLVPQQSITQLGVTVDTDASYEVMGFDGRKSLAHVASIELIFSQTRFPRAIPYRQSRMRRHGTRCSQSCQRVVGRPAAGLG